MQVSYALMYSSLITRELAMRMAVTRYMKLCSMSTYRGVPSDHNAMRDMGRWIVYNTLHWSALSFPRSVVPQFRGAGLTHDGKVVLCMSPLMKSRTSAPKTGALVSISTGPGSWLPPAVLI